MSSCFYFREIFEINSCYRFNKRFLKSFDNSLKEDLDNVEYFIENDRVVEYFCSNEFDFNDAKKRNILSKYPYRFFDPYFYFDNNECFILSDELGKEINFDYNFLDRVKEERNDYDYVNFEFIVKWMEIKVKKSFLKEKFVSLNYDSFSKEFESFFVNKSFFLMDYVIDNLKFSYKIENENLYSRVTFDLNFEIKFVYKVFHEDLINITLNKDLNENKEFKKIFKKKFLLCLPSDEFVESWVSGNFYYEDDFIFFKNDDISGYFRCIISNNDEEFDVNKWKKEDKLDLSFCYYSSFFDSLYGKECIDLLNKSLSMLSSEYLGSKIVLHFSNYNFNYFKINDWFRYNDIKYRIVKIERIISDGEYSFIVSGIEYFPLNDKDVFDQTCEVESFSEGGRYINFLKKMSDVNYKEPSVSVSNNLDNNDEVKESYIDINFNPLVNSFRKFEKEIKFNEGVR